MPNTTNREGRAAWDNDFSDPGQAIVFNAQLPAEDEKSVRCLVCGSELQYITHSHIATHPEGPNTIEDYKERVAEVLDIDEDEVPIMSADLQHRLAEKIRSVWESGKYDHFRRMG